MEAHTQTTRYYSLHQSEGENQTRTIKHKKYQEIFEIILAASTCTDITIYLTYPLNRHRYSITLQNLYTDLIFWI